MVFLIELSEIIRELSNDDFTEIVNNEHHFMRKYPQMAQSWEDYIKENKIKDKDKIRQKWSALVREIRYFEDQEFEFMYQRIMLTSRHFLTSKRKFFNVITSSGNKKTIPDKSVILNRLVSLSEEFFTVVYPSIMRFLNFNSNKITIISQNPRGNIKWSKTIQNAINISGGQLMNFVSEIPKKSFLTDENILFYLTLQLIQKDAFSILQYQKLTKIGKSDKITIQKILNQSEKHLREPLFTELNYEINSSKYVISISDIEKFLSKVEKNIYSHKTIQKEYLKLVKWVKNYIYFNADVYKKLTHFSLKSIEDIDEMFEYYFLFEFMYYLNTQHDLDIAPLINSKDELTGFHFLVNGIDVNFAYNKNYHFVPVGNNELHHKNNRINPDYTFEIGKNCYSCLHNHTDSICDHKLHDGSICECSFFKEFVPIVLDAKNWRERKKQDLNKVMSYYLMELNQWGTSSGFILFSNYTDKQQNENPIVDTWEGIPVFGKEWNITHFVTKCSTKSEYEGQMQIVFEKIYATLLENVNKYQEGMILDEMQNL